MKGDKALDLTRASRVYGDSRAAYFLDGQYYAGDGTPVSFEEAALPNPKEPELPEPQSEETPSYTVVAAPKRIAEPDAIMDPPVERGTKVDATYGDSRLLKLKPLSGHLLATMVMKAGGSPATGPGSKKKNIAWLMENVKS